MYSHYPNSFPFMYFIVIHFINGLSRSFITIVWVFMAIYHVLCTCPHFFLLITHPFYPILIKFIGGNYTILYSQEKKNYRKFFKINFLLENNHNE